MLGIFLHSSPSAITFRRRSGSSSGQKAPCTRHKGARRNASDCATRGVSRVVIIGSAHFFRCCGTPECLTVSWVTFRGVRLSVVGWTGRSLSPGGAAPGAEFAFVARPSEPRRVEPIVPHQCFAALVLIDNVPFQIEPQQLEDAVRFFAVVRDGEKGAVRARLKPDCLVAHRIGPLDEVDRRVEPDGTDGLLGRPPVAGLPPPKI